MAPNASATAPFLAHATVSEAIEAAPAVDPLLERVAMSLRGARARTGLSEERIVAILQEQGIRVNLPMLRRAERTGVIDFALAARLADAYGTTTDCLAGRRLNHRQLAPPALPAL